jgi:hypothetical protein
MSGRVVCLRLISIDDVVDQAGQKKDRHDTLAFAPCWATFGSGRKGSEAKGTRRDRVRG